CADASATERRSRPRRPAASPAPGARRQPSSPAKRWYRPRRIPTRTRPGSKTGPRLREPAATSSVSAVRLLDPLLVLFAANAQGGLQPRLQALHGNGLSTLFARAKGPFADLLERVVDLREKALLAPAQAKCERMEVFRRSQVHFIRQIVGVQRHVFVQ